MWRQIKHSTDRSRRSRPRPQRRAELLGGPLDGLTVGEPWEAYVQFILVPSDGSYGGPYPVHTYLYDRAAGQYRYGGCGVQAPPATAAR